MANKDHTTSSVDYAYVYVIQSESGLVKIGYSANPEQRFTQIENSSGLRITHHQLSPLCANYREVEAELHQQFTEAQVYKEWFKIPFETARLALEKQQFAVAPNPETEVPVIEWVDFEGHSVPLVHYRGEVWLTAETIGLGLEYAEPRVAVMNIYQRNRKELDNYSCVITVMSQGTNEDSCDIRMIPQGTNEDSCDIRMSTQSTKEDTCDIKMSTQGTNEDTCDIRMSTQGTNEDGCDVTVTSQGAKEDTCDIRMSTQGRATRIFNEEGSMFITLLSSQPRARIFRKAVMKIFMAYRRGELNAPHPATMNSFTKQYIDEAVEKTFTRLTNLHNSPKIFKRHSRLKSPRVTLTFSASDIDSLTESEVFRDILSRLLGKS